MKLILAFAVVALLSGCQHLPITSGQSPARSETPALSDRVLQVEIPTRRARAPLTLAGVNGDVETWMTTDNISLSLQRGVLVASRGLGFDLMGAGASTTIDALAGLESGIYRRHMRYLTGDHQSTYLMAGCSLVAAGAEVVDGRKLDRFEESCIAKNHEFTNLFWLTSDGVVVQSRQWLSPEVGYLVIKRLK